MTKLRVTFYNFQNAPKKIKATETPNITITGKPYYYFSSAQFESILKQHEQ
jgi:hypothetical protein